MKSSDLKYKIQIYEQVAETTDFGRTKISYKLKYECRARVNYLSGNRSIENDAIFYSVDRTFIVRSYVPITYTDVIAFDGDYWQVLSIDKIREFNDIVINTTRLADAIKIQEPNQ